MLWTLDPALVGIDFTSWEAGHVDDNARCKAERGCKAFGPSAATEHSMSQEFRLQKLPLA